MKKVIFLLIISLMLIVVSAMGFKDTIAIETSDGTQAFDGSKPVVIDNSLTITGNLIEDAKVTINNITAGDVLGYNADLISGVSASYDASKGTLSFSGTLNAADWQKLLRTVTFNGSSIGEREITFSIGNGVIFEGKEHFYEYIPERLLWEQANEAASNSTLYGLRGYLATITSMEENEYILSIIDEDAWLGASDDYTKINSVVDIPYVDQNSAEGNWYWVAGPEAGLKFSTGNGNPVTEAGQFSYWIMGEPNNNSGDENFGHMIATGTGFQGRWNDAAFEHNKPGYVVEYGDMPGDPDIILQDTRTIVTPPSPPTSVSAVAGDESATISFNTPSNNGGSVVTSYTVITSPDLLTTTGTGTSITVTGLTNGTAYNFTVTATNASGTSDESRVSNSITPNDTDSSPSLWAQAEVDEARNNDLVLPEADDNFQKEINRELFCKLVINLVEQATEDPVSLTITNPFQDTNNSNIIKAYQLGIVNGMSDTEFGPDLLITREQVAAMIMRSARKLDELMDHNYTRIQLSGEANFEDLDLISNWALQDIREANALGIMKGVGNNEIDPKGNTTVEQSILLILRVFNEYLPLRDK